MEQDVQQIFGHFVVPLGQTAHQGREALLVTDVHARPCAEQRRDHVRVLPGDGGVKGGSGGEREGRKGGKGISVSSCVGAVLILRACILAACILAACILAACVLAACILAYLPWW